MLKPDFIIKNAVIHTMDGNLNNSEALAVKDGRFAAVGGNLDIANLIDPDVKVIDAEGRTLLPGFNDAHCHLLSLRGKQLLQADCSPARVKNIADIIWILKAEAAKTPPGEWILGGSYDFSKLEEGRHPLRSELDLVSDKHPVHLRSQTCHCGVVNSKAFEVAGVTEDIDNPPGGEFGRDVHGRLNGLCLEEAHFMFVTGMGCEGSFVPSYTTAQLIEAVDLSCRETASFGITSVGDGLIGPPEIEAFQASLSDGKLSCRVYMNVLENYLPRLKALGVKTGFGSDMLRFGAVKSFVDGAIAAHTAWLKDDYAHRPGYHGIPTKSPEDTESLVLDAHSNGYQMEIHANGDMAIDMVLTAVEKAQNRFPERNLRHRIAHCTVINQSLLGRIKAAGVIPLPFTTYVWEHGEKMPVYGDRIEMMFAHRSFLDAGVKVAASSDNPCGMQDVMTAVQAMVTRQSSGGLPIGTSQKISVEQALWIYTMGGAYSTFEEKFKGSIETGKLADFVILDDDPSSVDPFAIRDIKVCETWLGGNLIFQA
jgi:hypothetical protein